MNAPPTRVRLRLAIDVTDAALADRVASAFNQVEGLELVGKDRCLARIDRALAKLAKT